MLEEGLSSGAHLGLERSALGSQAGGRLECHPQPPARASEFCPSESRNVTKCEAMWPATEDGYLPPCTFWS